MNENTEPTDGTPDDDERERVVPEDRVIRIAAATMRGDLIHALVERLKAVTKPWGLLNPDQQEHVIEAFARDADRAIVDVVKIIAGNGRTAIVAKLEQATIKDGIKAVLTLPQSDPGRHALTDAVGKQVLLSVVDVTPYRGGDLPTPDATTATQPDLPLGDAAEGALDALEAGIAAADGPEDPDAPETPAEPVWRRDDGRLYDAILLVPPEWTGIAGDNTEDDLSAIAGWSDEQVLAAETFCEAVARFEEGEGTIRDLPPRPEVLGGPLAMPPDDVPEDAPGADDGADEDAEQEEADDEADANDVGTDDGNEPL